MAVYPIKCYFNTGLSGGDVFDSLDLIEFLFQPKTFESVWLLQDRDRATVKINASYETIRDCDYCIIGNTGYRVLGVSMLNENVAQLSLECDYMTTAGVENIDIIEGWCLRKNPTDDTLFVNDIPEAFQPMEPLEIDLGDVIRPSTIATNDYRIVISTVQLDESQKLAESYVDEKTDLVVTVPQIPLATVPTIFSIGSGDDRKQYILPVGTAYNYNTDIVRKGVQSVRSLGIESCITASYTIPAEYVSLGSDSEPEHREIGGIDSEQNSKLPIEYTSAVNKKVFSGQFMKYGLISLATGESQDFEPEVIAYDNAVKWRLMADPLPTGKPYAMPKYYRGKLNEKFYGNVGGGQWQHNTVEFAQGSGAAVEYAAYARKIQRNVAIGGAIAGAGVALATGGALGAAASLPPIATKAVSGLGVLGVSGSEVIGGAGGLLTDLAAGTARHPIGTTLSIGGLSGGIAGLTGGITNSMLERKAREIMFRAPEVAFSPIGSMQNYFGNTFMEYRIRLSDNDTKRFDKYLTANGYSVSEPLSTASMKTHTNFNYIMGDNIRVKTGRGLSFDTAIARQIQNGVRIWHTAPSQERLYNNPIKEVTANVV